MNRVWSAFLSRRPAWLAFVLISIVWTSAMVALGVLMIGWRALYGWLPMAVLFWTGTAVLYRRSGKRLTDLLGGGPNDVDPR